MNFKKAIQELEWLQGELAKKRDSYHPVESQYKALDGICKTIEFSVDKLRSHQDNPLSTKS